MCKPEPGPRCSGHAKAKLDTFVAQRNKKAANLRNFITEHNNIKPNPGQAGYSQYIRLKNSVANADIRVANALEVYRTTPAGLSQLFASYTASVSRGNLVESDKWRNKLQESWDMRRSQMQAYRDMLAAKGESKKSDEEAEFTQTLFKYDSEKNANIRAKTLSINKPGMIDFLAADPNPKVRATIPSLKIVKRSILLQLSSDEDRSVQEAVYKKASRDTEILKNLSKSQYSQVRTLIARNWETPESTLQKLSKDKNRNVSRSASKTLEGLQRDLENVA